ncbi:pentatricopeptide repeat-containing protein At1g80550, mitochondrial-like [Zingiber officinale]|uniref:Pentatricopeptide repeat-containing protein n=1 Tax=Zingiber officinale TaxID=94328 RepID=A0A8J5KK09_ZINOF|nr:pentatricopeptide repeat-containing protein At1g80550, mitochondrial-like [Zingiber officinale]KAG6479818.1 hypothetical protein ZIOFF_063292 [Zingiber officinale]
MRLPSSPNLHRLFSSSPSSAAATSASSTNLDLDAILETLSSYANDWQRALDFFHWSAPAAAAGGLSNSAEALARTVDILGKHFEFPLAWSLISSQSRILSPPDLLRPSFRVLFNRLAAAHLVNEALAALYRAASEYGLRDRDTFHQLVDALCDHRHAVEAEELCLRSKSPPFPPNTKTYNLLLRGWLKLEWWRKCREFWEEMDQKGVEKDLHSYSIYMDICYKSGKPWKTVKVYKELKKKGFPLDVVVYNTVIQAIGVPQGADLGIRMYREMLDSSCKPNVVTFNIIIKLLCREGRFREGYAFVDQMNKVGCAPNAVTYHSFFQNMSQPKEILGLYERMLRNGTRPRMDTYVMLIKKFGRWGFLRPVLMIWESMKEQGHSPNSFAYHALIDALMERGLVDMARKYDEEMVALGLSPKPRKFFRAEGTGKMGNDNDDDILHDVF